MTDLLLLFTPFFALVLLGWTAARTKLLPVDGIGALNGFVLYFALSAMVFRLAASGALYQTGLSGLLAVYALAGGVVVALALAWTMRRGLSRRDGGLVALVIVFPNTGFLGLPLLTGLLGPQAAGPVMATLVVDVLLLSSLCLAWAHSSPGRTEGTQALATACKGALRNPLLWSMALGMAADWSGLVLPHPVDETLRLLGLAATPAALFTLGAILARSRMMAALAAAPGGGQSDQAAALPSMWIPVLLKLVLHPLLVGGLGLSMVMLGWPVPAAGLLVMTLAAALPSASNVSMLAEREGADTALVARVILWTTACALVSLTLWAHGLGVQPVAH